MRGATESNGHGVDTPVALERLEQGTLSPSRTSEAASMRGLHDGLEASSRPSSTSSLSLETPPTINEEAPLLLKEPLLFESTASTESTRRLTTDPQQQQQQQLLEHTHGESFRHDLLPDISDNDDSSPLRPIRKLEYNSDSHIAVLFQMNGSVWPYVFPYCVVNVLFTALVFYLQRHNVNLAFPSTNGHTFMSIMVSFLVVTRANITYQRFMEAREYLNTCYRSCRELVHYTCVLSMQDTSQTAQEWRRQVAYRTIVLLRITMTAIDHGTTQVNTWDVVPTEETLEVLTPQSDTMEPSPNSSKMFLRRRSPRLDASMSTTMNAHAVIPSQQSTQMEKLAQWAHGVRTIQDENLRAPIVLAYNLRETILRQRNGLCLQEAMHVNEELKILSFVSEFNTAFHGLQKLVTTPFPFPLVQMTRTFLFFWIFSMPLVLVDQMDEAAHVMIVVFFITYGFLGLEYVSMELEDPFGDDPNDLDHQGMAQMAFEDIYIAIYKLDGTNSAELLREKVVADAKAAKRR